MKTKLYLFMSLVMGVFMAACDDDDDYSISTNPIMDASSVVTGSTDVTATSVTFYGTVSGLSDKSSSFYTVGFNYGYAQDNLSESVNASLADDNAITATITGLTPNSVIYYQAFATLKGQVTYAGEIKSLVTTDATVATADAVAVDFASAQIGGQASGATADATCGIVIATTADVEAVRAGLIVEAVGASPAGFVVDQSGLMPNTHYYYAAYLDLGSGVVYGDVKDFTTSSCDFDLDNDLVDLGLSVKWARYNVGAKSETDLGGLFGFGDLTGVNNSNDPALYASADTYFTAADVANKAFNGSATLPTAADFEELFALCSTEWTTVDGVAGYKFTGPNGNSIFLPAAGSRTINEVANRGTAGHYMTGTINPSNSQFAVTYQFDAATNSKTTTPVYEAVAVRAISTARNVSLDKSLLYKTWEIDFVADEYNGDGSVKSGHSLRFAGPVYFYGTDDSWRTVTNKEPIVGNSWSWEADASQTWAFGNTAGYMTLNEDGTIVVKKQDGEETTGTFTIDEVEKTITADIDLLTPSTFDSYADKKTKIKIMSVAEDMLSLGFFRDSDPATTTTNYIPQSKKYGIPVNLLCLGGDWQGAGGVEIGSIMPDELDGLHTLTYSGSCVSAMVFTIDLSEFSAKYPNAIVTLNAIRCDGQSIEFDGSRFFYGDIEGNGNFRIELFNIWGKGSKDGLVVESPFSDATNVGSDDAFHFSEMVEFDLAICTNPTFTPAVALVNGSWAGPWADPTDSFTIGLQDNKYVYSPADLGYSYTGSGYEDGPMVFFIDVPNLYQLFPKASISLTELATDGNALTWDNSKIVQTSADGGGVSYRMDIWNIWGDTGHDGTDNCAFGPRNGDLIPALAFSNSLTLKLHIDHL